MKIGRILFSLGRVECIIFVCMFRPQRLRTAFETHQVLSVYLQRTVRVDLYVPVRMEQLGHIDVLFINDGQDLLKMDFDSLYTAVSSKHPLVVVALHAGSERRREYGVAGRPDYMNRGDKAKAYQQFVIEEVFLLLHRVLPGRTIGHRWLAGFSLGGLSAFDLLMDEPELFDAVGVFSGSFWWRSKPLEDGYDEERDRIMHAKIRNKRLHPHVRFFLEAGQLDEQADRNKNGIIDSIDDTMGIIYELERLGYSRSTQIFYIELEDGAHDVATWARVMPQFIQWLISPKMEPAGSPI